MNREASSFRDPSGYVFCHEDVYYRAVAPEYQTQYDLLMRGLYKKAVQKGFLIQHDEVEKAAFDQDAYVVLKPRQIPFISYPYEWCFGQLKAAALTTLRLHRLALDNGMILKDASAYNIQFCDGRAVLIDTLSFEVYHEGALWPAYGQFCRHFLAPLFLMKHVDVRMLQMMRTYIDGIPLDLASGLLRGKGGLATKQHIHWHAKVIDRNAKVDVPATEKKSALALSKVRHIAMIDSLIRIVERLKLEAFNTEWGDYYDHTNYSSDAAQAKEAAVAEMLALCNPKTVWDFGANNGHYTRIALSHGSFAVAFDYDPVAVERNYNDIVTHKEKNLLPLLLDLSNPSPAIGFANRERETIGQRMKPDCIMLLAVVHHMAISNNIPLEHLAEWLSGLADHIIIEFVPKEDSQVERLLATRDDIFPTYTQDGFEQAFGRYFTIRMVKGIQDSKRTLYLLDSVSVTPSIPSG